ncbi:UTP--glucose-1-phosphate uridylyltransferase, partial [Alkalihalophilus pseudofirmus]|nr:UTP--glucose-1-phosphate uridylyltransferase [Alkalihalophilus pseudofirmus]
TDAMQELNQIQRVFAYDFEGKRFDVGEKIGFVKTTIDFALQNEELRDEVMEYLKGIVRTAEN